MKNSLIDTIQDYWDSAGIFIGAAMTIYGFIDTLTNWGLPASKQLLVIGVLAYTLSGLFHIRRTNKDLRDKDEKLKASENKLENSENKFKELEIAFFNQSKELDSVKVELANGSLVAKEINNPVIHNVFGNTKNDDGVPSIQGLIYQIGLILDSFDKKFDLVRHSKIEDGIDAKFNDAKAEIYKVYDEFLPQIKSILKNSEKIEIVLKRLYKSVGVYQATLEKYIQQEKAPLDSVYMKTGGLDDKIKNAVYLQSEDGKYFSDIKEYVKELRWLLKENI